MWDDALFLFGKIIIFEVIYIMYYGNSEDKDGLVLQILRKRELQVDGKMSGLWRMEYYGGRDGGYGQEGFASCCFCSWIRQEAYAIV